MRGEREDRAHQHDRHHQAGHDDGRELVLEGRGAVALAEHR
jgi:hypothetical protein